MAFTEKYVTVTGGGLHDGSSEANAWTLNEAHTNMVAGQRINIKAGTYTLSQTLGNWPNGSNSTPVGFRGYKSTIGDLDNKPTTQLVDGTDRPLIQTTNSSYYFFTNEVYTLFENIVFSSQVGRPALYADNSKSVFNRCKFLADPNGSLNATPCVRTRNDYSVFNLCHFDGNGGNRYQNFEGSRQFVGCLFENLQYLSGEKFVQFSNCIIRSMSVAGLRVSGYGWLNLQGNTFYNISGNALQVTSGSFPTIGSAIIQNNVFHTISGNAIQSSGNKFDFFCDNNLFYNVTGSNYSNTFNLNRNAISESSDPFVDAAQGDYSLVSSSGGYGKAQPNPFEGFDADSRRDVGAIQHADPSSSGGGSIFHPLAQ